MTETLEVKKLNSRKDLMGLVSGDKVAFGVWEEECLCYDYPGLQEGELFFLSRFKYTCPGFIGVIFEHRDNLKIKERYLGLKLDHLKNQPTDEQIETLMKDGLSLDDIAERQIKSLPRTKDGLFHYGVNLVAARLNDETDRKFIVVNPGKYREFNDLLNRAGL